MKKWRYLSSIFAVLLVISPMPTVLAAELSQPVATQTNSASVYSIDNLEIKEMTGQQLEVLDLLKKSSEFLNNNLEFEYKYEVSYVEENQLKSLMYNGVYDGATNRQKETKTTGNTQSGQQPVKPLTTTIIANNELTLFDHVEEAYDSKFLEAIERDKYFLPLEVTGLEFYQSILANFFELTSKDTKVLGRDALEITFPIKQTQSQSVRQIVLVLDKETGLVLQVRHFDTQHKMVKGLNAHILNFYKQATDADFLYSQTNYSDNKQLISEE